MYALKTNTVNGTIISSINEFEFEPVPLIAFSITPLNEVILIELIIDGETYLNNSMCYLPVKELFKAKYRMFGNIKDNNVEVNKYLTDYYRNRLDLLSSIYDMAHYFNENGFAEAQNRDGILDTDDAVAAFFKIENVITLSIK